MLNQINLIGSLGQDPETRYFPNGDQQTTVTLATSKQWKDKNTGEKKQKTTWHNLVFNRGLAKVASEYLKKGSKIFVSGEIDNRSWEKDGQKHYRTVVLVNEMQMLGTKSSDGGAQSNQASSPQANSKPSAQQSTAPDNWGNDFDDNIPFMRLQNAYLIS